MLKDVSVRFGCGRDLLNAYWGYLSDGGLVIPDDDGLDEGAHVALRVVIASSNASYRLAGRVVRRHRDEQQAVIAFDPGEPHDMLLTAALAETDNVPARNHRRFPVDIEARVSHNGSAPVRARIVNIGLGGCCVRLPPGERATFAVGADLAVAAPGFAVSGFVVWTWHADRGVQFSADSGGLEGIKDLVQRLVEHHRPDEP